MRLPKKHICKQYVLLVGHFVTLITPRNYHIPAL